MSVVQVRTGWVGLSRWVGLTVGLAGTARLLALGADGPTILLAGPVLGLALLATVLLGALVGRAPAPGAARRAVLETRRLADYLPPGARPVALLLGAYGLMTAVALARPTGASPRRVYTCNEVFPTAWPWPDPEVVAPAFTVVLLGLIVAGLGLRRIVDRPRPARVPVELDDLRRHEAATAVVAACAVLVAGPLAGTAFVTGAGLVDGCGGSITLLAGWLMLALAAAAGLAAAAALLALLRPRGRVVV